MAEYYVSSLAGGSGIGTSGDPFTLLQACDQTGTGNTFWVKADGDYNTQDGANGCIMHLTVAGASSAPNIWEGYDTSTGDGGVATIDATSTYASAAISTLDSAWLVIKNLEFLGGTGIGFDGNSRATDYVTFKNCRFSGNGDDGVQMDNYCYFENCEFHTNTGAGIDCDSHIGMYGCKFYANDGYTVNVGVGSVLYNCLIYDPLNGDVVHASSNTIYVINTVIDCEGQAASRCVRQDASSSFIHAWNNIFYDADTSLLSDTATGELNMGRNNVFASYTNDNSGWMPIQTGDGIGDRDDQDSSQGDTTLFTNAAIRDYTLPAGSDALEAGLDMQGVTDFWEDTPDTDNPPDAITHHMDSGAFQAEPTGGGGSNAVLGFNKIGGRQA